MRCRAHTGNSCAWKGISKGCDARGHWVPEAGSKSTQGRGCWLEKCQDASISPDPGEATSRVLCTITRGASRQEPLLPLIPTQCTGHLVTCHSPGMGMVQAPWDAGSRAVLTIPVRAGTEGQVGAQHHGRDQVLEGWNLNQWQPREGDSKGTLGRKEGTGLLPKPWLPEDRGMRREGEPQSWRRSPHILNVP